MNRHGLSNLAFSFFLVILIGCGQDNVSDLDLSDLKLQQAPAREEEPTADTGAEIDPSVVLASDSGPAQEGKLAFSLEVGNRFPLQKTIEQTLVQYAPVGELTSKSALTLMFAISVDKVDDGRRLLGVHYQRVRYRQEVAGDVLTYDSRNPPQTIPDSLQVYHGLVGNGFQFWIGADNRIVEVLDFPSFLRRCVRFAPPDRQPALLEYIVATQEDEGFANFVDESIGMLHYKPDADGRETVVRTGEQWSKERQIMRPLPMSIHTTYTLAKLDDVEARIEIFGSIRPMKSAAVTVDPRRPATEMVTLRQGVTHGSSIIDRESGLPIMSRITRRLDMQVQVGDHQPYNQQKTIVTTVQAFRDQSGGAAPVRRASPGEIVQASGEAQESAPVVNANGTQPASKSTRSSESEALPLPDSFPTP